MSTTETEPDIGLDLSSFDYSTDLPLESFGVDEAGNIVAEVPDPPKDLLEQIIMWIFVAIVLGHAIESLTKVCRNVERRYVLMRWTWIAASAGLLGLSHMDKVNRYATYGFIVLAAAADRKWIRPHFA